jgi:hypothetical protein
VNFRLVYEDEFIPKEGGIVTFKYRTGQKINNKLVNGVLRFLIDGVEYPIP